MQAGEVAITLWDRGELDDVRQLIAELGLPFSEGEARDSDSLPTRLLISSGRILLETIRQLKRREPSHHFLHLVIVESASRALTVQLEREGCDMVVHSPIHPVALRLIVQRALYNGANKRLLSRVAIGEAIKLKSGTWTHDATLSELSISGCGLITDQPLEIGARVSVLLPATMSAGAVLQLESSVVGIKKAVEVDEGLQSAALIFRRRTAGQDAAIEQIMQRRAVGQTGVLAHEPGTLVEGAAEAPPEADRAGAERRAAPRGRYELPVLARGAGRVHSLIGRDLSTGGMCVSHEAGMTIGARLWLAVYGPRGTEPVVVWANVVRLNEETGIGLEFEPLEADVVVRLQAIVDSLPQLSGAGSLPANVVSEVL